MSKILLYCLFLLSFAANAVAGVKLNFSDKSNGNLRFAVIGNNLCPANVFKIRVYNNEKDTVSWYKSKTGNEVWNIGKDCAINQELKHDLLKSGQVIELRTYKKTRNGSLEKIASYRKAIPCYEREEILITLNYLELESVERVESLVCGSGQVSQPNTNTTVIVNNPPVKSEAQQNCIASAKANSNNDRIIDVNVSCNLREDLEVMTIVGNQIICRNHIDDSKISGLGSTNACSFERNPKNALNVQVEITGGDSRLVFKSSHNISKGATYDHPVTANYLTANQITPVKQDKAFKRGYFWEAEIRAKIEDRDIDSSDPQNVIRVELINSATQAVVDRRALSSGAEVKFNLMGQFIKPRLFGDNHWDDEASLQEGENRFIIRVYDAYQNTNYIDLPVTSVFVNK